MAPTHSSTIHCQIREAQGLVIRSLKACDVTAGSVERIAPVMALTM